MKIAISGKMKSGKTTLATELYRTLRRTRHDHPLCLIMSFADPIRDALRTLGIEKSEHPTLYRQGAQYIGTDLCRAYDSDWWVNQMDDRVRDMGNTHIVIDDMRFQNEYDWCKANGFILVRLDISEQMQYTRGAEEGTFQHPSETGLDHIALTEWDVWCPENTTVEQRVEAVLLRAAGFQNGLLTQID